MKTRIVAMAVVVGCALIVRAQAPEFDAASVKPNKAGEGIPGIRFPPSGHFTWTNMTLRQLINSAYGDRKFVDVVGGPKWVYSDRFDIAATAPSALASIGPDGSPDRLFAMLRQLVESRFRLRVHDAIEERPIFALQVAKTGAFGPKLVKSDVDCAAVSEQLARGTLPPRQPGQAPPTDGPSIFTALQEQLGLKLQATRGPVRILVVDGAELPSPN